MDNVKERIELMKVCDVITAELTRTVHEFR